MVAYILLGNSGIQYSIPRASKNNRYESVEYGVMPRQSPIEWWLSASGIQAGDGMSLSNGTVDTRVDIVPVDKYYDIPEALQLPTPS